MATYSSVPGDLEPGSILDLVQDCREFAGDLGGAPAAYPGAGTETVLPLDISPAAVLSLTGFGDYGS